MPTQVLGCQQATCTLKVGGKGQGTRRHKRGTEARHGHQREALPGQQQAWRVVSKAPKRPCEPTRRGTICLHWLLGSRSSLGRQASARF